MKYAALTSSTLVLVVGAILAGIGSCDASTLELVDYWPSLDRDLPAQQSVYLRVRYTVDAEARIGAELMRDGVILENAPLMTGGTPFVAPGNGEVMLWFESREPFEADAIRLQVRDTPRGTEELMGVSVPLAIRWSANGAVAGAEPAWVIEMRAAEQARFREQLKSQPPDLLASFLAPLLFLSVPAYPFLQWWALRRSSGRLRIAAWLPFPFVVIAYIVGIGGAASGSNLSPIWILFASAPAALYLLVLIVLRRWQTRAAA